jgi:hypothetical protein
MGVKLGFHEATLCQFYAKGYVCGRKAFKKRSLPKLRQELCSRQLTKIILKKST